MAMTPNGMANFIIGNISGCTDAYDANNRFLRALCIYVESNAQVFYSWTAALPNPPFTPDPIVIIQAKIKTAYGTLNPNGATTCETALARFSADLNQKASIWRIEWPTGFTLSPAFVIPTINITPSMATEQQSAMISVCSQIIAGLKLATPTVSGTHISYVGAATFTQII